MKQHIMLVDNNREQLTVFMNVLEKLPYEDGFKCTYADNTAQALLMLRYLAPDYIFINQEMPVIDGMEFILHIRKDSKLNAAKVYLCTKAINEAIENKAKAIGADGCLQKNQVPEELRIRLQEILHPGFAPA